MRARIRLLHSPDCDLGTFAPEDPERFAVFVRMLAGPSDGPGEESFDFLVCSPGWLSDQARRHGPTAGAHHVVVDTFHWPTLERFFQRLVSQCTGGTWDEVAMKLSRYGRYEFAD